MCGLAGMLFLARQGTQVLHNLYEKMELSKSLPQQLFDTLLLNYDLCVKILGFIILLLLVSTTFFYLNEYI
jgi:UPF0716 family protein affecting phage T7 exclusion